MAKKRGSTRREFISQGVVAAGVAPAVLGLSSETFAQVNRSDILVGMIGTGGRGQAVLKAVSKVSGVRVAALCDINSEAIDQALEIVGSHQPKRFSFHPELLAMKDLDAVLVETPPHLHREHVVETLRSGRHCSAAKPLALTVNELDDIRRVVRKAQGILHVDQQLRYRPQYVEAMPRIHAGEIGKVGFVRAQRYGNWDGTIPSGPPQKPWLYRVEQSGDTIVENQIHNIDVINWVMNSHPIRATGLGGQNLMVWEGNELLDNYGLTFEYPDNRFAIFSKVGYAVSELSGTFIHAYGSKGGADVSYEGAVTLYPRGKKPGQPSVIDAKDVDMDFLSIRDFFESIRTGKQPAADVEVGRDAALTTLLGRKAVYEKRTVEWEELLDHGAAPRPPYMKES